MRDLLTVLRQYPGRDREIICYLAGVLEHFLTEAEMDGACETVERCLNGGKEKDNG